MNSRKQIDFQKSIFTLFFIILFLANGGAQTSSWNFVNFTNTTVTPEMAKFGSRGVHVHDPSTIVKCKDEYWVFYTGRGVPSYHSKDLAKWEFGPPVFTNVPS